MHKHACFVTLTYDDFNLPPGGSLRYRDVQLFLKRLRKAFGGKQIRFFCCGEYGESTRRAHYHLILYGIRFDDAAIFKESMANQGEKWSTCTSVKLNAIWGKGFATVQDFSVGAAGYVARYCIKKVNGDRADAYYQVTDSDGVIHRLVPEFARMSTRPGIGASWFEKYRDSVYMPDGYVGATKTRTSVPAYYDKLEKRRNDRFDETIAYPRQLHGRSVAHDNTTERLAVKDEVLRAKMKFYKRGL